MEPVTHVLTGACLARIGFNRRAAYTTLTMAIAAEFPDIDTLWGLRGDVASFQHHRGITHTFLGLPFEAAVIVAAVYALHRWRLARAKRVSSTASSSGGLPPAQRSLTQAPVRWPLLFLFALLALLSHLLLDYTNNYGIRPFFPFNPRWYAASITFIFDPLMFLFLLAALVLPLIFRLVSSEVGARREPFVAKGWAIAALTGVVALWTLRATQHDRAVNLAFAQTISLPASSAGASPEAQPLSSPSADASLPQSSETMPAPEPPANMYLQAQRVLANPDPVNPFHWWTVSDYGPVYGLGEADTHIGTFIPAQQTEPKLATSPALQAAEATPLGRAYLDWSPMPFLTVLTPKPGEPESLGVAPGQTLVVFRDPRFIRGITAMRSYTPLQGCVELDAQNRLLKETMGRCN